MILKLYPQSPRVLAYYTEATVGLEWGDVWVNLHRIPEYLPKSEYISPLLKFNCTRTFLMGGSGLD